MEEGKHLTTLRGALIFSIKRSTRSALRLSALHPRGLLKPPESPSVPVCFALQLHPPFLSLAGCLACAPSSLQLLLGVNIFRWPEILLTRSSLRQFSAFAVSLAKRVVVTVGGSTRAPDGATTVFEPDAVTADVGDVVVFNCESLFYSSLQHPSHHVDATCRTVVSRSPSWRARLRLLGFVLVTAALCSLIPILRPHESRSVCSPYRRSLVAHITFFERHV